MNKTVALLTLALALAFAAPPEALASVHGVFRVVKGKVQVKDGKSGKVKRAKIGQKVFPKDTVITGKDSRAKIVMVDKNVINVSPDSNIVFENYEYEPKKKKKNVLLNVIYGKVRSKVNQKYDGKNAKFQVKTKSAVAGVRGTDFLASFDPQSNKSQIVTFEGEVQFGQPGPDGTIRNPVSVKVGEMADASGGAPPKPPKQVPKKMLADMEQDSDAEKADSSDARQPAQESKQEKEDSDKEQKQEGEKGNSDEAKEENPTDRDTDKKNNKGKNSGAKGASGAAVGGGDADGSVGVDAEGSDGQASVDGDAPPPANDGDVAAGPDDSAGREPASIEGSNDPLPPPPGDSGAGMDDMFMDNDFAGSGGDEMMVGDDQMMQPEFDPVTDGGTNFEGPGQIECEFCDRLIEEGTARVLIQIQNGAQ